MDQPISDIYLIRRQKSRAGCMTALFLICIVALIAAAYFTWSWVHRDYAGEVEFPDMPLIDAPQESAPLPEPAPAATEPASAEPPAPAPQQPQPAEPPTPASVETESDTEAVIPPDTPEQDAAATKLLNQAKRAKKSDLAKAREKALEALALKPGNAEIESFLNELAMPLLASRAPMQGKISHTIQSGDSLSKIAATYNTPVALIKRANDLKNDNIRLGYDLLLLDGRENIFAVLVNRKANDLLLTLNGQFFKRYRVGTGSNNGTPLGEFKIVDKIAEPVWWRGDGTSVQYTGQPGENLLGTHWLALNERGYGLHGTWEPETIGTQSSAGCVRLTNEDIEELYSILPRGTIVRIVE